jgi:hypothetical protein
MHGRPADITQERDKMGERPDEPRSPRPYPGEKARQGRIVLNTPGRRRAFLGGLIGIVVFALLAALLF